MSWYAHGVVYLRLGKQLIIVLLNPVENLIKRKEMVVKGSINKQFGYSIQ